MSRRLLRIALPASLSIGAAAALGTGVQVGYDLSWHTIDGGGGSLTSDGFELCGTVGQPDAAGPMTGGGFELTGGFWAGAASIETCPADIAPAPGGDGVVGINDFLALLQAWGTPGADIDGDGDTGITDFLALLQAWGACP